MSFVNGVMFQFFHWFLDKDDVVQNNQSLWNFLQDQAPHLHKIGITALWIPPVYKAGNVQSVGYDPYDHFDLGEFEQYGAQKDQGPVRTKYGTKQELVASIKTAHSNELQIYVDIVINHKSNGEEGEFWQMIAVDNENRNQVKSGILDARTWTNFTFPKRQGKYSQFKWSARHFDSTDAILEVKGTTDYPRGCVYRLIFNEPGFEPQEKSFESWTSLEKGNFDYLTGADLDFGRSDVRREMKDWGVWLMKELDFDGVRLDAVKHITADYMREWLGHLRFETGKQLFAVGEYIDGGTQILHSYSNRVSNTEPFPQSCRMFDFPLRFKFQTASWQGLDLRQLNQGTLMTEKPEVAVTFVENHDYQYGREHNGHVREWFKPLAYGFILLREQGYPCIFFPDYYGSHDKQDNQMFHKGRPAGREYLDILLQLRRCCALGQENFYAASTIAGWVRLGFVEGATGAMAVVINTATQGVQAISMATARSGRRFLHYATIKFLGGTGDDGFFAVVKGHYDVYGSKATELTTDGEGKADFLADSGTIAIWLEEGVVLT